jgi:hypothetical protein
MPEEDAATLALDFDVGFAIKEKVNTFYTLLCTAQCKQVFLVTEYQKRVYSYDFAGHLWCFHVKIKYLATTLFFVVAELSQIWIQIPLFSRFEYKFMDIFHTVKTTLLNIKGKCLKFCY